MERIAASLTLLFEDATAALTAFRASVVAGVDNRPNKEILASTEDARVSGNRT
jgi:hypothetical protein